MRATLLTFTCLLLTAGSAQAQVRAGVLAARVDEPDARVLLTAEQALREIFPQAAAVVEREFRPSVEERREIESRLSRPVFEPSYPVLLVYDAQRRFMGYALVTEERGKYRPITFMVGVTADLEVRDAAVMVYRESRGGEVQRKRFLVQYRWKTLEDPIRINRDIINISGATISVQSMNAGVRKTLAVIETAFGGTGPRAAAAELRPLATPR